MDITGAEQIALDDALVAPANRLKIGKSNLRLSSDLKSKEATLQVVYDVLKLTPFYKAFQITADVLEIYMQDGEIKVITDVNVNKLHQPWRSFAAGMYHKKNVDYAYLLWEDFVYQVENKNVKKSNEMYYPRFTKVIVNFFMTKDQSIPRRNSVNWHYARDDHMFTTIKVVSRHEDTQLYGAILPNELTNEDIRNSESYKEYYAIASGAEPPKTKASVKKKQVGSDKTKTPPTTKGKRLKTSAKAAKLAKKKQPAKTILVLQIILISLLVFILLDDQDDDNEQTESDNDDDDIVHPKLSTFDEEQRKDKDYKEEVWSDDEASDEETQGVNVEEEELDKEETNEEDKVNSRVLCVIWPSFLTCSNPSPDTGIDSIFNLNTTSTSLVDVSITTIAETPLSFATTLPPPPTPLITHLQQTPVPTPETVPSSSIQDLPNFGSLFGFDHRLKTLENDFLEFKKTNQFAAAVSSIPGMLTCTLLTREESPSKTVVQLQSDRLRDEAQDNNEEFIKKLDDNIKKIINEQTSHAVATNLSELELKKILIDKMESNKSIHRSDEQKNLYKPLVDAYESDKLILDTYGYTVSFKRRRDDEDKDEEPSAGSNRGFKRRRARKEPESTSGLKEKTSKTIGKSTKGSKSHHESTDMSVQAEEPMHTAEDLEEPAHLVFVTGDAKDKPDEETS
ncbi:hypothetical protein Tco_0791710 [Tanacetum coccineum]